MTSSAETNQSEIILDESQEVEFRKKIQDLEQQKANLEEDLKMTVIRQREAGESANEMLRKLESEISKYYLFAN